MEPNTQEQPKAKFLRNRKTGVLFPYTATLAKRKDMEPMIDKDRPLFEEVVDGESAGHSGEIGKRSAFLKNVKTGAVFPYSAALAKNRNMIPWERTADTDAAAAASKPATQPNSESIKGAPDGGKPDGILLGSSVLESSYDIGGEQVVLGDIVRAAFETSGLSVEEWNGMDGDEREALLAAELQAMLGDADDTDKDDGTGGTAGGESQEKGDQDDTSIPPVAGENGDLMVGEVTLAEATKAQMMEFAEKAFGEKLPKSDSIADMRAKLAKLIQAAE